MQPRQLFLAALMTATASAGCTGQSQGGDDTPSPGTGAAREYYTADFFPADLDHDHNDPVNHTASHNSEFVAFHDCTEDGVYDPATTPGLTDAKEWGDYLFVNQATGFCILDISDPNAPMFVSHFEAQPGFDIDVSSDGNWAFHGTQRNPPPGTNNAPGSDAQSELPRGLYIVDISDKANPTFESFYPVPTNGVHTVHYHKHQNGDDIVLLQTYDWTSSGTQGTGVPVPNANAPGTPRVEITRLVDVEGTRQLERLGVFTFAKPADQPFAEVFPHDCTAQQHPFTNQTLMYCAYWNAGMVIVDITDPANPVQVSQFDDMAPSKYNQYHYVLPSPELIDGRHITAAAPELQIGIDEVGFVRIFDTTDPANPEQIGSWTLPGVPGFEGGFLFSPHQFDIYNGTLVIGHNHGGVWALDISDADALSAPRSAALFMTHGDESLVPEQWPQHSSVWVALEHRGYIYSVDTVSGVHVNRFILP